MCSGEDMTLTCPGREVIVVLNAEYSQTSCSQSQVEEECLLEDLMGFFSSHCFGKKTCTVTTQDVISALNKPCLGTGPLAVSSTCVNGTYLYSLTRTYTYSEALYVLGAMCSRYIMVIITRVSCEEMAYCTQPSYL